MREVEGLLSPALSSDGGREGDDPSGAQAFLEFLTLLLLRNIAATQRSALSMIACQCN